MNGLYRNMFYLSFMKEAPKIEIFFYNLPDNDSVLYWEVRVVGL